MDIIKILSSKEIEAFDIPPILSGTDRKRCFYTSQKIDRLIRSLRSPTSRVGFMLQIAYFRAFNKFYAAAVYYSRDIEYTLNKLNIKPDHILLSEYTGSTYNRHQTIILEEFGIKKFTSAEYNLLLKEAVFLSSKCIKPRTMFASLLQFIRMKGVEIPNYYPIAEIITKALRIFENSLIKKLTNILSNEDRKLLDELLMLAVDSSGTVETRTKSNAYKLTLLKRFNHSAKPSKIKENLIDLKFLDALFAKIKPIIQKLELSPSLIKYYASSVIKSQIFQLDRRENRKYLMLIAFVVHQHYILNDMLIEKVIQATQTTLNSSERENRENYFLQRKTRNQRICSTGKEIKDQFTVVENARKIIFDERINDPEKISKLKTILSETFSNNTKEALIKIEDIAEEADKISKGLDYYDILEKKSKKLQNRVSDILKSINFEIAGSNEKLLEVIDYYKRTNGNIKDNVPMDIFSAEEVKALYTNDRILRVSLFKVLFFKKISSSIRSGALNLNASYKFRPFEDYLISFEQWNINKENLLEKTGLSKYSNFSSVINQFKNQLSTQYNETNKHILNGNNSYITIKDNGKFHLATPAKEKTVSSGMKDLFPKKRFIPVYEILSSVNDLTNFTNSFEHWQIKNNREKPPDKMFFAGIIGYGCNLGHNKLAQISKNLKKSELENTVNWYFSRDNIIQANDKIIAFIDKIDLSGIYRNEKNDTHTSSDGQKFDIAVDSLNANYSFKYFGKNQGVSVYCFIDQSHRLFYSTVINPTEREAAYVIDGLMHNDVVKTDIHSTDTHGYSEIVFAVTHLLGIAFAPRIKNFEKQTLYSLEKMSAINNKNYTIKSDKYLNPEMIEEKWDDILRMIVTIKLKHTSASQLFKRLSSYSKDHPLYRALKGFGRIVKTMFLLKYIDDLELRQIIEKQLNKIESSNKFSKAVFFGNNQEFQHSDDEAQLISIGCKSLIENAIVCWNYLYLTKEIKNLKTDEEKERLIELIKNSSVVLWQHINFQGEYDFSDDYLKDSIKFSLPDLLNVSVT